MKRFLSAFIALVGLAWGVEMLSATAPSPARRAIPGRCASTR